MKSIKLFHVSKIMTIQKRQLIEMKLNFVEHIKLISNNYKKNINQNK